MKDNLDKNNKSSAKEKSLSQKADIKNKKINVKNDKTDKTLKNTKTSKQKTPKNEEIVQNQEKSTTKVALKQKDSMKSYIFKKVFSICVDIVLYPLIILSLFTSMISMTARDNGQVRSFLGYSVVTILTGSMKAGGFDVGDVVFLKTEKPENIKTTIVENLGKENESVMQLGDVIAFYKYSVGTPSKHSNSLTEIKPGESAPEIDGSVEQIYKPSIKKDAIKAKVEVIFHRVVGIYVAADGTYFYETRGDTNGIVNGVADWTRGIDSALVNEHLVVGKYTKAADFITNTLTFMITPDGMFWVIILPLAVIVFLQIIELMTIVFDMATEKKVLEGSLPFDSEESIKAKVGLEMSEYNKIYFYDISPQEQKLRVREFLWEEGFEKNPKKEANIQDKVNQSVALYKNSRDKYWEFWIENAKSEGLKRRLRTLQRNANIIVKTRMLQNKK